MLIKNLIIYHQKLKNEYCMHLLFGLISRSLIILDMLFCQVYGPDESYTIIFNKDDRKLNNEIPLLLE